MKKKLMLKKDTLRDLAHSDLNRVVGASDTVSGTVDTCIVPDLMASGSCNSF